MKPEKRRRAGHKASLAESAGFGGERLIDDDSLDI